MDASQLPKGQSDERNGDGRPINLPGIYRNKDTGVETITSPGSEGVAQADAWMSEHWKGAWERVGDVPSRTEILKMRKDQLLKDIKAEAEQKKAEEAELKAAETGGEVYEPAKAK